MDTMQTSPNGGIINNPLSGLLRGIVQGAELASQLRREQDTHEAMQRATVNAERETRLKDIQTRMDLETRGRPIENGMVMEPGSSSPGPGGLTIDLPGYARKADAKRRVTYKNADGQSLDFELYSADEQARRTLERMSQSAQAQGNAIRVTDEMARQTGIAKGSLVHPSALTGLMNAAVQDEEVDYSPDMQAVGAPARGPRRYEAEWGRIAAAATGRNATNERLSKPKVTKTITANDGTVTEVYSDGSTKDLGKVGAVKVAPRAAGGNKPSDVDRRANDRQQRTDQKEVDRLQQEEQKLHGIRSALGDAMKASDDDTVPNPLAPSSKVKVNAAYRSLWKNKIDEAAKKIEGLQQSQKRLVSKWGGDAAESQPPAAPRRRAVNAKGDAVEWNGTAWVPAPK